MSRIISPKARFLTSTVAVEFADIVSNPAFQYGVETALMEFVCQQPAPDRLETAAYRQHELQGARNFASILLNLCESETPPRNPSTTNLLWQHKPRPGPAAPTQQPVQAPSPQQPNVKPAQPAPQPPPPPPEKPSRRPKK